MSRVMSIICGIVLLHCPFAYGQTIYWSNSANAANPDDNTIQRTDLSGSLIETLVSSGFGTPFGMALDIRAGKMYFTDLQSPPNGKIMRANLDGTGAEDLVTGLANPTLIELDLASGKIYWASLFNFPDPDRIQRANLDGSDLEDVVTGLSAPIGLALDLSHGRLYWAEPTTRKIRRANLDGTGVEDVIVEAPFAQPVAIAIDSIGGLIYWTDNNATGAKIHRANLDGLDRSVLVGTGLDNPGGITLDLAGGKMYWVDTGTEKIQRADLDGTGVEDLVTTGLRNLSGIAIDVRVSSAGPEDPIPTVSQWGLTALALLLLTLGTVVVNRKQRHAAAM